jgi:predicted ATP-grasp superfamily ATP-dependent carboligase
MKESAPAVLLGLSFMGLAVARSLGRRGIPVFGIDKHRNRVGAKSRYVQYLGSPADDESLREVLLEFGRSRDSKSVLFPFTDEYLVFISRNKEALERFFWFPSPNERSLEDLVAKESMAAIFRELGILTPGSTVLRQGSVDELEHFKLNFPVVIKPDLHGKWLNDPEVIKNIGVRKALLVDNLASLKDYCSLLGRYDTIVAQEFIPGKTENLYYYVGYRNTKGQILVSFVGRKLRTLPDMFGSESLLQSVQRPDLCKIGEEILNKLNYAGPAGLDFKFDARDQTYKLIEINCRLGISDGLLMTCGIDIPFIYYQDVQGGAPRPELEYKSDVYWCWIEKDIEWFQRYQPLDGFTRLKSCAHFLFNKYSYPVYASDDLKPIVSLMVGGLKRLMKKASGMSG